MPNQASVNLEPRVVQSVRQVQVNNNGVGNILGSVVGAVTAGAIGSVLGGLNRNNMDNQYGQEIVVKLNSGKTVATVLRINGSVAMVRPGQAVNVFFSSAGGISNIVPR